MRNISDDGNICIHYFYKGEMSGVFFTDGSDISLATVSYYKSEKILGL